MRPGRNRSALRGGEDGSAVIEFIVVGVGVLVPMVYIVLSVMTVHAAAFASTQAVREAGRAFSTASTPGEGRARALAAARIAFRDQGMSLPAGALRVECADGPCLAPGSAVEVRLDWRVPLPWLPGDWSTRGAGGRPDHCASSACRSTTSAAGPRRDDEGPSRDDRGSVLLLGIGIVVVCVLAIAALVDVSAAFLQRQQLQAVADAAALSAAQAIDLPAYYENGALPATRLAPASMPVTVAGYLIRSSSRQVIDGLRVTRAWSDGEQVVVSLSSPLRLPFMPATLRRQRQRRVVGSTGLPRHAVRGDSRSLSPS